MRIRLSGLAVEIDKLRFEAADVTLQRHEFGAQFVDVCSAGGGVHVFPELAQLASEVVIVLFERHIGFVGNEHASALVRNQDALVS